MQLIWIFWAIFSIGRFTRNSRGSRGYSRVIVGAGVLGALGGTLLAALAIWALARMGPQENVTVTGLLSCAGIFGFSGMLAGVCVACAIAPTAFYQGYDAWQWLDFIGTDNVPTARTICGILAAVFLAVGWVVMRGALSAVTAA